jgi:hypothetical protein
MANEASANDVYSFQDIPIIKHLKGDCKLHLAIPVILNNIFVIH